jgi:hypothetical protein
MAKDTSFVSKEAVNRTQELIKLRGHGFAFNAIDSSFNYPKGTMTSYFKKQKKLAKRKKWMKKNKGGFIKKRG